MANATGMHGRDGLRMEHEGGRAPRAGRWFAVVLAALCFVVAVAAPEALLEIGRLTVIWPPDLRAWSEYLLQLHWVLGLIVVAPFIVMALIVLDLHALRAGKSFALLVRDPVATPAAVASEAEGEHQRGVWEGPRVAVETSWEYEKARILRLQCRLVLQALLLGNVTTFALTASALAWCVSPDRDATPARIACSMAAATVTVFLVNLARILLRISGGDITTRAFSWGIRSIVFVMIADIGLFVLLGDEVSNNLRALLLGVFVGATGDQAIRFMLEKASKVFATGAVAADPASPLLELDGITDAHVERLKEEGIVSLQDLAFAPTARLFFSTTYSLPQICNWQDRALLRDRVGKEAIAALGQGLNIRGAIGLMMLAHDLVFGAAPNTDPRKLALGKALDVEPDALALALAPLAHDEDAMRIRYYWSAVVAPSDSSAAGAVRSATTGHDEQRPRSAGRASNGERAASARPEAGVASARPEGGVAPGPPAIITLSEPVLGPPNAAPVVRPRGAAGSSPPTIGEGE